MCVYVCIMYVYVCVCVRVCVCMCVCTCVCVFSKTLQWFLENQPVCVGGVLVRWADFYAHL